MQNESERGANFSVEEKENQMRFYNALPFHKVQQLLNYRVPNKTSFVNLNSSNVIRSKVCDLVFLLSRLYSFGLTFLLLFLRERQ